MDIRQGYAALAYAAGRQHAAPSRNAEAQPGEALGKLARDFAETLQRGEETARAAMTGGADPQALVEALAQTELAVETAVTVRDKVVEAYQEILRMPV
ncbi:flagellar hook-basal body complex protein FliE [Meinhardsimonia xiamenensis]|jgi:flagellar hook-basal body complex protein FliE|uniref:Flagellar hook-basal body complex protein FliE n=1 Tax=Meinhardsimonia xiamenensis TaxID=990712 RepID=A0A1G9E9N4_9RHOB|nr:flagellar hook-basal body complex protein FliE [Meinhardsimonia xiamenensis]PRX33871.1 flagellar hook-basal body complex protein FliE [Meinhardsimonia xiamenensis]SDK72756.1 flagellar hook-basal body complex protein FliE [Meinhardsimonia xiamenensis]